MHGINVGRKPDGRAAPSVAAAAAAGGGGAAERGFATHVDVLAQGTLGGVGAQCHVRTREPSPFPGLHFGAAGQEGEPGQHAQGGEHAVR